MQNEEKEKTRIGSYKNREEESRDMYVRLEMDIFIGFPYSTDDEQEQHWPTARIHESNVT